MQSPARVMLHASNLVFAFRGLWTVRGLPQERTLERQIADVICELTGARDGRILTWFRRLSGTLSLRLNRWPWR